MAETLITTPFGRVSLSSPSGTAGDPVEASPDLPEGFRLDGCLTAALTLAFGAGETQEVTLECTPAPGAAIERGAGDMLESWEVEADKLAGAFAMRDHEWLAGAYGLHRASFSESRGRLTLRLRADQPVVAAIPFAAAWTLNPLTENDALAPWFAVDRALPFRRN